MIKPLRWLEIAEYISLAGAVTGTILASVFGQLAYAAWPLCIALFVNVLNRRYGFNQDWYSRKTIAELEEKISTIESARLLSQEQFHQAIAQLHNPSQNIYSSKALESLVNAFQQLRSQQKQAHQAIKLLKDQLDTLTQQFKDRPELEQIESLTEVIVALQQLIDDLARSSSVDR